MNLKGILEKKNKKAKDLAIEIGIDEPMISKFVNYKCLPIPAQMKSICKSLDCKVSDIYKNEEIFYQETTKKQPKSAEELNSYNLCVRLPNEARKYLASANLQRLGYKDKTQWIMDCYKRLVKRLKNDRSKNAHRNGRTK